MMMITAKFNIKKVLIVLAAVVGLIIALVLTLGNHSQPTAVATMSDNDSRVQFLKAQGWDVTTSPTESSSVRIPKEMTPVYDRYNELQKSQGYDLSQYAGKTVMRYVYQVNNFPGATEPVYATLLVYKNQIIGGDITNTAAKGAVQKLKKPGESTPTTVPTESAAENNLSLE